MVRRHQLLGVVALTLVMSVVAPRPAATTEPDVSPASAVSSARLGAFDAPTWCRPVVNAAVDPAPLTCWLTLAAAELPPGLAGMNLGDLPAWADVDPDAIGAELTRYTEMLEAERIEAERAATRRQPAAAPRVTATPTQPGYSLTREEYERLTQAEGGSYQDDGPIESSGTSPWAGQRNEIPPMPAECNGA